MPDGADVVARDLEAHSGRSLVLCGERLPPAVHLLVHAINDRLANVGQTVQYYERRRGPADRPDGSLAALAADMRDEKVRMLIILAAIRFSRHRPISTLPVAWSECRCGST